LFDEGVLTFEHLFPKNLTVKGSISSKWNASVVFKFPSILFNEIAKTSVGFHGSNLSENARSFKYGLQVEFDV
jgi:hypothetical protein